MDLRNAPGLWMRRIGIREPPRRRVVLRAERRPAARVAKAAGEAGLPERLAAAGQSAARRAGGVAAASGEAVGARARLRAVAAMDAMGAAKVRAGGEAIVAGSERSACVEAGSSAGVGRLAAESAPVRARNDGRLLEDGRAEQRARVEGWR
jgi:hypothetical protein